MEGSTATVDTTAPVTSAEPTTAAPATTETATPTTSARPTSVADLSKWMAAKEAGTPGEPTDAATPETAATGQAAPLEPASSPTAKQGPIPFEVHKKTLDNAYAERDAAKAEVQRAGATLTQWGPIAQQMANDPAGFIRSYISEVAAKNPEMGARLRSEAARVLGTRPNAAPQQTPIPAPDVEIVNEHGQVTGRTYSADQLAKRDAWNEQRILASVNRELQPIKAERAQKAAEQHAEQVRVQAEAKADAALQDVDAILDGAYSGKDAAILTAVNAAMDANPSWSVYQAARHVRQTHIVPTLEGKATAKALERFQTKAAGNTANGAGTSATPVKPRDAKSLAKWMEQHAR